MKVSFECDQKWGDLSGDSNTRRHCERCDHAVYNLSGMTREQAQRVITLHEGQKLCVHFVTREGRVVHDGDPLAQLEQQRRGSRKLLAAALIAQAGFLAFADTAYDHFFDPFAAVADALSFDEVPQKFNKANDSVTMGGMMF